MKANLDEAADAAKQVESLRLEREYCQSELKVCRLRIGELEQAEALLVGENRLLEIVAKGESLPSVLDGICRLVEESSSGSLCSILLLEPNGDRLWHGAAPSLPASYTSAFDGRAIGPRTGPCGRAAYFKKPVVVCDIAADPLGDEYRDLALAHGLQACWSTPIFSTEAKVLGSFAVLSREPRSPTPQHQRIIAQITHLASIAIERNRTEAALKESEERFRRMADSIPEVMWFTALDPAKVLYVSPSFERVWGLPVENLYQNPHLWMEAIHSDDRERVTRIFSSWVAGEPVSYHNVEYRIVQPGGSIRWIHERGVLSLNEAGKPCLASGISMDITERIVSQEETHAAKARFEGILEIADDAIISVDSDQRIVLFNQGAEKVFGYSQSEVIGQPIGLLLPQRFAQAHREHVKEFAGSPDVARAMGQRREVFGLRKDGREFPAEASISKLDLGGELVFTVILRDITERKQAAETLCASEKFARGQAEALTRTLDALARESAPDRLVEHVLRTITEQLDAHSTAVWRREGASGLAFEFAFEKGGLVTQADEVIGKISPTLDLEDIWPWAEVFRTGKPSVLEDIRKGPDFPWRARVLEQGVITILIVPMLIAGQVTGVIGIRFTQKRRFRAEEMELAQALANQAMLAIQLTRLSAQSRQAAVMAERNRMARDIHDTLAQGFTGVVVQLEAAADAKSKKLAKEEQEHLCRALSLARESLQEARRSVRALRPQALEEKDLCEALGSLIQKMTAGTSLRAEFILQGKPRKLPPDWDENLLRVGQEVLTNALRHAHASEFKTQLGFGPEEVRLELRDNGRGFDPAGKHEGLGLIGMRERVEGMGGQLTIQSGKGAGTEILIVLPLADYGRLLTA